MILLHYCVKKEQPTLSAIRSDKLDNCNEKAQLLNNFNVWSKGHFDLHYINAFLAFLADQRYLLEMFEPLKFKCVKRLAD